MRTSGYSIFRAAVLGFAITAAFVSYQLVTDSSSLLSRSPSMMLIFVVLCPPSLLSVAKPVEVGTNGFYFLWALIGVLNAALYGTVRTILSKRQKRTE